MMDTYKIGMPSDEDFSKFGKLAALWLLLKIIF